MIKYKFEKIQKINSKGDMKNESCTRMDISWHFHGLPSSNNYVGGVLQELEQFIDQLEVSLNV